MKDTKKEKSLGFSMFFDKDTSVDFNFIINMAFETAERHQNEINTDPEFKARIESIIKNVIDPFGEKYHALGFCIDPNCGHNKKEDEI